MRIMCLQKKTKVQTERDNKYDSWKKSGIALALYDSGLTLKSVLFQCKKNIFQHYHLFPESFPRIATIQEETSTDVLLEWPKRLPLDNALLPCRYFRHSASLFCHIPFIPHLASPVIQRVTYLSYKQVRKRKG